VVSGEVQMWRHRDKLTLRKLLSNSSWLSYFVHANLWWTEAAIKSLWLVRLITAEKLSVNFFTVSWPSSEIAKHEYDSLINLNFFYEYLWFIWGFVIWCFMNKGLCIEHEMVLKKGFTISGMVSEI
jgi:hypothetical protein